MRQIDRIRNTCINTVETQYASRMEKLVNELRLEDAESILSEMAVDDDTSQWFFMDDITNWNLDELPLDQIVWEDQE
jgi:hypothetical protein|tara:strand:- start:168 stop:398 length:231 start_codon:yes stop_codon:yes gene_type:complete